MLGTLFINLSSCLHYWFYKKETQYIQSQILAPIANTPFMLNSCIQNLTYFSLQNLSQVDLQCTHHSESKSKTTKLGTSKFKFIMISFTIEIKLRTSIVPHQPQRVYLGQEDMWSMATWSIILLPPLPLIIHFYVKNDVFIYLKNNFIPWLSYKTRGCMKQ